MACGDKDRWLNGRAIVIRRECLDDHRTSMFPQADRGRGCGTNQHGESGMKTLERVLLSIALAAALFGIRGAGAETYPDRPIQVIVPFAGGSASDVVTRIIVDRMSKSLGQPMI